ncbi:MAG: TonB-dependent receptor [Bacteroidales bacterium]|jgi:iron complex outermembrane receptor protein|nr:TonB-dependent receptor [Bacteroidales bacterium]MCK9498212.1 TonB-dependent receptor [Bacteroidales bacterium]MDY0313617.1 TonB-dependent receptor [Bacteroidales bacterium]NLB87145.1 TonB-dependent receptor [Bacteroidales bacterium]
MRKILFIVFIFIFSSFSLFSQTVLFSGKVIDADNKDGLFGVNIIINSAEDILLGKQQLGTSTDFNGNYKIALYPGNYVVKFVYIGFEEVEKKVELLVGKPVVLDVNLSPVAEIIEEVVVSAGKFEQKLSDVTVSMEVLKPKMIESNNAVRLDQALNMVPGVDVNDGQPSIRASTGWSYGAGSRVIILMDDLPIMSADAGDVKWNYIPIENISQVEVVKGASSALFGSSALGGVINVRSAYPTSKPVTKISYFNGIFGNPRDIRQKWWGKEFFANSNSPLKIPLREEIFYFVRSPMYGGLTFHHSQQFDNLDLSLGGNHYIDEGYRENDYERRSRFNTNLRYRSKKIQGLAVGANTNFMAVDNSDFFMWKSDTNAYQSNTGLGTIAPTQGFRMNIDPYVNYYRPNGDKFSLRTRYFLTENVIPTDTMKNSKGHTYYGEFQYQTVLAEKWNIATGVVNSYSTVNSNLFGDHFSNNLAFYGQVDVKLGRLKLSGGLRGEYFVLDSTQTESLFDIKLGKERLEIPFRPVFRTGVNYSLTDQTFVRASFGQGYRFPSIAEKYTATALGMVNILPNPRLLPEAGWSTELGVKQGYRFGKWRGFADIAFFNQDINNMMEFTFGVFNPETYMPYQATDTVIPVFAFQSQNYGDVRISGADLSASIAGKVGNYLIMGMVGYTYNYPVLKSGVDSTASSLSPILKYRNRHSVKADVGIETKRITFGANIIWRSAMENVDKLFCDERDPETISNLTDYAFHQFFSQTILPGYWDYRIANAKKNYFNIDLRFGFKFSEYISANFIVKNLLNAEFVGRPGDMHAPRRYEIMISSNF